MPYGRKALFLIVVERDGKGQDVYKQVEDKITARLQSYKE